MSNKLLLAASVFAISLSLANAASASCDGPYLAVRGGVTNHSLGDKDENVATDKKLDVDDNAMMFSGAIAGNGSPKLFRYTSALKQNMSIAKIRTIPTSK